MTGVLGGFAALAAVIAVGWIVGRSGILGAPAEGVLSRLSFFVASPALLFLTLAEADTGAVFSAALIGTAGSALLAALLYVGLAWWRWRLPAAQLATGGMASSYVNAGTLGIPVSAYVLGDASYVAPVLLFQVLVMAPVGLAVLAGSRAADGPPMSRWRLLTQPVRTPVVIGCALGLLFAAVGAGAAGVPPRAGRAPRRSGHPRGPAGLRHEPARGVPACDGRAGRAGLAGGRHEDRRSAAARLRARPRVAGLDGVALLAVTVTSALPTAQNVFVYASSYDRGTCSPATSSCSAPCSRFRRWSSWRWPSDERKGRRNAGSRRPPGADRRAAGPRPRRRGPARLPVRLARRVPGAGRGRRPAGQHRGGRRRRRRCAGRRAWRWCRRAATPGSAAAPSPTRRAGRWCSR